ncbi:MAG: hypothetical protein IPN67_09745 [Bacteroidales bacterium]|nr:hypothetical protein [Bacteroidales bacterium]
MERRTFVKSVGLASAAAYFSPKIIGNNQVTVSTSGIEGAPALEFPALPMLMTRLNHILTPKLWKFTMTGTTGHILQTF